ncbi:MAG: hypothetical protein AB8B87_27650 [Granulosicoccus sp.]
MIPTTGKTITHASLRSDWVAALPWSGWQSSAGMGGSFCWYTQSLSRHNRQDRYCVRAISHQAAVNALTRISFDADLTVASGNDNTGVADTFSDICRRESAGVRKRERCESATGFTVNGVAATAPKLFEKQVLSLKKQLKTGARPGQWLRGGY